MSENVTLGAHGHAGAYTTPVEELAQSHHFKRVGNEWHGPNPAGNGATTDGYILNDDGTSYDRKLGQHFPSVETARNFSIPPDEYEPVALYKARNGNGQAPSFKRIAPKPISGNAAKCASKPKPINSTTYDYPKDGALLFQTIRREYSDGSKDFTQRRPDERGGWIYNLKDVATVLYHSDAVKNARIVIICEGEKAADEVNAWLKAPGLYGEIVATTNAMGAGKWRDKYSDELAGKHVCVLPDNDDPGRRHAAKIAQSLTGKAASIKVVELEGLPEKGDLVEYKAAGNTLENLLAEIDATSEYIAPEATAIEFEFTTDNDLDDRLGEIEWLWPGYIPRGFITAAVGDQDVGKSQFVQSLCDVVIRGHRWPDGQPHEPHPDTKLLWIDTEGSIALFHQRIKQWGMKRGCFILPPDPLQELTVDDEIHWMWIETAIKKFQFPLIVFDALSGAHKNGKENGNDEMKPVMKKLAGLAQKFNLAVVVVHHLNKPVAGCAPYPITIHRLRGASAISQYCRSILALGTPDLNQPEKRRMDVIKLNLAKKPAPVGYELSDSGPLWGDAPEPPKERRAIDDALDFLEIALKDGPRLSEDVQEEAKAQKIGTNALRDAMKAMKIKPRREGGKDGRWFWHPTTQTQKDGQE